MTPVACGASAVRNCGHGHVYRARDTHPVGRIFSRSQGEDAGRRCRGGGEPRAPADLRIVAAFLEALAQAVPGVDALSHLALGPDGTFGIVLDLPRGTVTVEKAPGRPYFEAVARDAPTGTTAAWATLDLHAAIDQIVVRA